MEALVHMGALGYQIPNSVELLPKQCIDSTFEDIQADIQITEDAKSIMPNEYIKEYKAHDVSMTQDEAIDMLLLQFKYGLSDNKTLNTIELQQVNDKDKKVFFDPFTHNSVLLSTLLRHIGEYFAHTYEFQHWEHWVHHHQTEVEGITLNDVLCKTNNKECFETHTFRLIVEFMVSKGLVEEQNKDSITLRQIKDLGKEGKTAIFNFQDPRYFLKPNIQSELITFLTSKQENQKRAKQQYYWRHNKHLHVQSDINYLQEGVTTPKKLALQRGIQPSDRSEKVLRTQVPDTHKLIDDDLSSGTKESYTPTLLGNLAHFTNNKPDKYQDRQLFNWKNLHAIKYCKERDFTHTEEKGCKITPLYQEKRRNIDDLWISTKKTQKDTQNIVVNTLVSLANQHSISLKDLSYIIIKSINDGGYRSDAQNPQNHTGKKLAIEFQKEMKKEEIYTGRTTNLCNANVGLRLKRLPKAIVELLKDREKDFKAQSNQLSPPSFTKARDQFIMCR